MTRRRDKKISDFTHQSKAGPVTIPIYLTPDDEFKGSYATQDYVAASMDALKPLLVQAIDQALAIQWVPILEVEVDVVAPGERWNNDKFGYMLGITRYYLGAASGSDRLLKTDWRWQSDEERLNQASGRHSTVGIPMEALHPPHTHEHRHGYGSKQSLTHYLPYNDDLYGLLQRFAVVSYALMARGEFLMEQMAKDLADPDFRHSLWRLSSDVENALGPEAADLTARAMEVFKRDDSGDEDEED